MVQKENLEEKLRSALLRRGKKKTWWLLPRSTNPEKKFGQLHGWENRFLTRCVDGGKKKAGRKVHRVLPKQGLPVGLKAQQRLGRGRRVGGLL